MQQSEFYYSYEYDAEFPEPLLIGVRVDPDANNPVSWAVVLGFGHEEGSLTEIAKVDNSQHEEGDIHIDRYYRDDDAKQKDFGVDFSTFYEAEEYIRENAARFAKLFLENHWDSVTEVRDN